MKFIVRKANDVNESEIYSEIPEEQLFYNSHKEDIWHKVKYYCPIVKHKQEIVDNEGKTRYHYYDAPHPAIESFKQRVRNYHAENLYYHYGEEVNSEWVIDDVSVEELFFMAGEVEYLIIQQTDDFIGIDGVIYVY